LEPPVGGRDMMIRVTSLIATARSPCPGPDGHSIQSGNDCALQSRRPHLAG